MAKEMALLESDDKRVSQDGWSQALMANLYARQGKPEKAEARIQAAMSLSPDNPQVLEEVADACVNLHDPARARRYIQMALKKGADIQSIKTDVELKSLDLDADKELRKK